MTQQGNQNTRVVRMFMGTRAELAPNPLPFPVFAWDCEQCKAKAYSVTEPPVEATLVCNVCASEITAQAEQDPSTQVRWNMTNELEESVSNIAREKKRPSEEVFNRILEWKLGREIKATIHTQPEKKTAEE